MLRGAANGKTPDLPPSLLQSLSTLLQGTNEETEAGQKPKLGDRRPLSIPFPALGITDSGPRARGGWVEKSRTTNFGFDL